MNLPQRYPLPSDPTPPGKRCLQVSIPDSDEFQTLFIAALDRLSYWFIWDRDSDHTGAIMAAQFRAIIASVESCAVPAVVNVGADLGVELMIRQNPDNPCLLESSLDGVTWCPWANIALCTPQNGQPGPGTGGTPPPGGEQKTCAKLYANQQLLLPTYINTGDTITLNSIDGAGWDGTENTGVGPLWRFFGNGDHYIGGIDVGFPQTKSGDPDPSAPHMSIVALVGPIPIVVPLVVGTPATIPGGVTNGQVVIQVNDSNLSDNQGNGDICVTVKNNAAAIWSHTLDMTLSPNGFVGNTTSPFQSDWVAGVGWVGTVHAYGGNSISYLNIDFPLGATTQFTLIELIGSNPTNQLAGDANLIGDTTNLGASGSNPYDIIYSSSITLNTQIGCANSFYNSVGLNQPTTVTAVKVAGTGFDPFA